MKINGLNQLKINGSNQSEIDKINTTISNLSTTVTNLSNSLTSLTTKVNGLVGDTLKAAYPIGAIYVCVHGGNPKDYFGFGTWALWGSGRVPVCVATGNSRFNTVEKQGGNDPNNTLRVSAVNYALGVNTNNSTTSGYPRTRYSKYEKE